MPSALLIAFHFPPLAGSSGMQRTLSFSRDLKSGGVWDPVVLTASPKAYPRSSSDQLDDIAPGLVVHRAFALDTSKSLSIRGRYPSLLALPDRWISWYPAAVAAGLRLIRRHRISVIWSTFPIATAHLIACTLARTTGLPWVADFRDPMVEFVERDQKWFPADPSVRRARLWTERLCAKHAGHSVFCTASARDIYLQRYDWLSRDRCSVIANGFDEQIFSHVEGRLDAAAPDQRRDLTLVHSGTLYPGSDRDPTPFFRALALVRANPGMERVRIVLRGCAYEDEYRQTLRKLGIDDIVTLAPPTPYRDAIEEMMRADGLLLFQGYSSNPAIPAKLYEYLRVRRPFFAMVDEQGETASLLRRTRAGALAPIEDEAQIASRLQDFVKDIGAGVSPTLSRAEALRFSRGERAKELEAVLSAVAR